MPGCTQGPFMVENDQVRFSQGIMINIEKKTEGRGRQEVGALLLLFLTLFLLIALASYLQPLFGSGTGPPTASRKLVRYPRLLLGPLSFFVSWAYRFFSDRSPWVCLSCGAVLPSCRQSVTRYCGRDLRHHARLVWFVRGYRAIARARSLCCTRRLPRHPGLASAQRCDR